LIGSIKKYNNNLLYLWDYLGYNELGNNPLTIAKEDTMSYAIQDAIEECIDERIASQIEDAIDDSTEVQSIKGDLEEVQSAISDLEAKFDGDFADVVTQQVIKNLTTKLVNSLDDGYVMVKKSYLNELQTKKEEG
jgi:hypothetical protein